MKLKEISKVIEDAYVRLPIPSEYEQEEIAVPFSRLNTPLTPIHRLKNAPTHLDVTNHIVRFRKRELLHNRGIGWEFVAIE